MPRALCSERLLAIRESRALFNSKSAKSTQLPPLASAKYAAASATASSLHPSSLFKASKTISSRIASSADARKLARYEQQVGILPTLSWL